VSDVDINTSQRSAKSKIQLEEQQSPKHADFRDVHWGEVVYPERFKFNPLGSASVFELVTGLIMLIFGSIVVIRMFFVADKTAFDYIAAAVFFGLLGVVALFVASILGAKAMKAIRQSGIFILPNGFPVNIRTIMNDYRDMAPELFDRVGYFDVEHARAGNPVVAPGEITYTFSPQNTYAPSNMPRNDENKPSNELLKEMLSIEDEESDETSLPTHVDFFDYIDQRKHGHIIAGINEQNELVQVPIMGMFNHLVGGAIGTGKSIYLRSLVYQFLTEADESDIPLKLGLADIENNTFPEFRGCRHVDWYASNYVEIENMTTGLLKEVERRKLLYEALESTPKDIERYNVLARREGAEELPIIIIIYDEFSALMHRSQAQQKRILSDILQLALRSRKYGIFLIIAGQTFKADLIDSAVLGQFNFNVAFKVRSGAASIGILGETGAEDLKHPGEALVKTKDGTIFHIQGLFIDDDDLLDHLVEFRDPHSQYAAPEIVQEIIKYAHEKMEDKVKFRELDLHLRGLGYGRADVIHYLEWMDEHKFTIRGDKNARILNWAKIKGELDG
jgi:hypothetical protein